MKAGSHVGVVMVVCLFSPAVHAEPKGQQFQDIKVAVADVVAVGQSMAANMSRMQELEAPFAESRQEWLQSSSRISGEKLMFNCDAMLKASAALAMDMGMLEDRARKVVQLKARLTPSQVGLFAQYLPVTFQKLSEETLRASRDQRRLAEEGQEAMRTGCNELRVGFSKLEVLCEVFGNKRLPRCVAFNRK